MSLTVTSSYGIKIRPQIRYQSSNASTLPVALGPELLGFYLLRALQNLKDCALMRSPN